MLRTTVLLFFVSLRMMLPLTEWLRRELLSSSGPGDGDRWSSTSGLSVLSDCGA